MDEKRPTGGSPEKKKPGRRVPWHVTLFTGAAWFLLCGGLQASVVAVSGAMIAAGALYLAWPRLGRRGAAGPGRQE